jgi:hypothetical protein
MGTALVPLTGEVIRLDNPAEVAHGLGRARR